MMVATPPTITLLYLAQAFLYNTMVYSACSCFKKCAHSNTGLNLTLYGSSNASYSATFDGQNFEPNPIADEGVLLAFASNNHELHNMTFTVDVQDPTEQVLVDKAIITTAAKGVYAILYEASMHDPDDRIA